MALSALLAAPLIDMLVIHDGPKWLAAYGVLAALPILRDLGFISVCREGYRLIPARVAS